MNITPTRIDLLKLLDSSGEQLISGLAEQIAPRGCYGPGIKLTWSKQGAARWGGAYVRPLEKAGFVAVNRHVDCGVGLVRITEAGRAILRRYAISA